MPPARAGSLPAYEPPAARRLPTPEAQRRALASDPVGRAGALGQAATRVVGPRTRRAAAVVAGVALASVLLPAAPIVLGILLLAAVGAYAFLPDLAPFLQPVLRVPVAKPSVRRARLLLAAGLGVLLVAAGSVGATARGRMRAGWEQRELRLAAGEADAERLVERARADLAAGNVEGAELALSEADAIADLPGDLRAEIQERLARVRVALDPEAVLAILLELSDEEFRALADGSAVPDALDFPERALSLRAVALALEQIETARARR